MTKKKSEPKSFFTADLELTAIDRRLMHYQVINPDGAIINDLPHLTMARYVIKEGKPIKSTFPVDDDFSLDFMNKDLENTEPYSESEAEAMSEDEKRNAEKSFAGLVKKQENFKKFQRLQLTIFKD